MSDKPAPNLEGRTAKCAYCSTTQPSSVALPFFEFRGPGSAQCDVCRYQEMAHTEAVRRNTWIAPALRDNDHQFTNEKGSDTDTYYCGCRGWD